jgi:hypothetical protein
MSALLRVACLAVAGVVWVTAGAEEPAGGAASAPSGNAAAGVEERAGDAASTAAAPKPIAVENGVGPVLEFPLRHNQAKGGETFEDAKGWKKTSFQGSGEVRVENGVAFLEKGNDMTGITWTGPVAKMNYEVTLEAMRVEGEDFFCGLTFPYGEDFCSLIVGGWGGTLVGLSSLDYFDAYNNETAEFREFSNGTWYPIRLRVTPERIEAWIEGEQLVDVETKGHKIGVRMEVLRSRPLGISTWRTTGAVRNMELKVLPTP